MSETKKPRQRSLAGMEPKKIPEIEHLAEAVAELCSQRMGFAKLEQDKRDLLLLKMREHKLKAYTMEDGRTVEVVGLEKVKVRAPKDAESNGEDE